MNAHRIASIARTPSRRTFIARRCRLGLVFTPPTCVVVVVVVCAYANPIVSARQSVTRPRERPPG
jgi:hypothetical protein